MLFKLSGSRTKARWHVTMTPAQPARACQTQHMATKDPFSRELLELVREHVPTSEPIFTVASGQPNWVVEITPPELRVETERSGAAGSAPQGVPAWMLEVAWRRLMTRGRLTHRELLATDDLNVKRSALVCAVLARLPGVGVAQTRPIVLEYSR